MPAAPGSHLQDLCFSVTGLGSPHTYTRKLSSLAERQWGRLQLPLRGTRHGFTVGFRSCGHSSLLPDTLPLAAPSSSIQVPRGTAASSRTLAPQPALCTDPGFGPAVETVTTRAGGRRLHFVSETFGSQCSGPRKAEASVITEGTLRGPKPRLHPT